MYLGGNRRSMPLIQIRFNLLETDLLISSSFYGLYLVSVVIYGS